MTIARFLLDRHEEISQFSISQDHQNLTDLSRERESLCHLIFSDQGRDQEGTENDLSGA